MIVIEDNRAGGVYDMPLGTLLEDVARNAIAAARRTRKTIYVFYASGRYFGVTDPIENPRHASGSASFLSILLGASERSSGVSRPPTARSREPRGL